MSDTPLYKEYGSFQVGKHCGLADSIELGSIYTHPSHATHSKVSARKMNGGYVEVDFEQSDYPTAKGKKAKRFYGGMLIHPNQVKALKAFFASLSD